MKINTNTRSHTAGLNAVSLAANILLAGVVFGSIHSLWLLAAIPLIVAGFGVELIEKRSNTNFTV